MVTFVSNRRSNSTKVKEEPRSCKSPNEVQTNKLMKMTSHAKSTSSKSYYWRSHRHLRATNNFQTTNNGAAILWRDIYFYNAYITGPIVTPFAILSKKLRNQRHRWGYALHNVSMLQVLLSLFAVARSPPKRNVQTQRWMTLNDTCKIPNWFLFLETRNRRVIYRLSYGYF